MPEQDQAQEIYRRLRISGRATETVRPSEDAYVVGRLRRLAAKDGFKVWTRNELAATRRAFYELQDRHWPRIFNLLDRDGNLAAPDRS